MNRRTQSVRTRTALRFAVLALVVLLGASLTANAYLVQTSRGYFQAANVIRLDPVGLRAYAAERLKPKPTGAPLIVFFGDSRAVMWPVPSTFAGYLVVNRGIGLQTTAQLLLRVDADVTALRPDVVVIEGGINDLKAIADFPGRRAEIIKECETNLEQIVVQCRRAGSTVVLVTVFGVGALPLWRRPFWSGDVSTAVHEVNRFLGGLSGDKVVLLDAGPVLADERGEIQRAYQVDYLHLSTAGYAALSRRLEGLLLALPR